MVLPHPRGDPARLLLIAAAASRPASGQRLVWSTALAPLLHVPCILALRDAGEPSIELRALRSYGGRADDLMPRGTAHLLHGSISRWNIMKPYTVNRVAPGLVYLYIGIENTNTVLYDI